MSYGRQIEKGDHVYHVVTTQLRRHEEVPIPAEDVLVLEADHA